MNGMDFPPMPDPLAKMAATRNARTAGRSAAMAAPGMYPGAQQLIRVTEPGSGASDNYMAYGKNAGVFGASTATVPFTPVLDRPQKRQFQLSYGTINGLLASNRNAAFSATGPETFAWGELTFDGQATFVNWKINVGSNPPPYVEKLVAPYGRVLAYNVLLAVVFRTAKGNLDGWQTIAGGNLVLSPFIAQIDKFTLTWNVYGL
jgi:hypothetical protein